MTLGTSLLAFLAAVSLLTITPGVDTALVLRAATLGAPKRAIAAALGIGAGCLLWGAAVALGLGALLAASELAWRRASTVISSFLSSGLVTGGFWILIVEGLRVVGADSGLGSVAGIG